MNLSYWQYYAKFYKGSYEKLILSVSVSAAQCLFVLPIAFLVRYAFDRVIPAGNVTHLVLCGVAIYLMNLANAGITLWTRSLTLRTTKIAIQRLRHELINKLYGYSRSYYGQADRGKQHAIIVQDTERVDVMSNALVSQFLPGLVTSAGLCCVLVFFNWFLFLGVIVIVPLLLLANRLMKRRVEKRINAFRRSFEIFSDGVLFVLNMMDLTRIQTAEQYEISRQNTHLEDLRLTSGSMAWLQSAYSSVQNSIFGISVILILVVGGISVATGAMTIGSLLSFYVAVALLNNYLRQIMMAIPYMMIGKEALITLYDMVQINDPPVYRGKTQIDFSGTVKLDSVYFQYKDTPVLRDVSLTIKPNEMVAIIGPNGARKSTIAYLVLGFYRPLKGQLYADEYPYSELDMIGLRRQIGVVTQNPIIFSGTIMENLTYGSPDADRDRIIRAAKTASADGFIQQLPDGYETLVGENGMLLSGGQIQRITIARAILRRPRLLMLDEPTNHLDEDSIGNLMKNLKRMDNAPACLIISHNIDIAKQAHHVYVLKEGRVQKGE